MTRFSKSGLLSFPPVAQNSQQYLPQHIAPVVAIKAYVVANWALIKQPDCAISGPAASKKHSLAIPNKTRRLTRMILLSANSYGSCPTFTQKDPCSSNFTRFATQSTISSGWIAKNERFLTRDRFRDSGTYISWRFRFWYTLVRHIRDLSTVSG